MVNEIFILIALFSFTTVLFSGEISPVKKKSRVLILCTGNSCRSQMAEGWGRSIWGDRFDFFSAGVEKKGLNPKAVLVMKEAGVDISTHTSKLISELSEKEFDYVITVCSNAAERCPVFPSKVKRIHHEFDDPPKMEATSTTEEEKLANYRRVRDEIRSFMNKLPEVLELKK